MRKKRSVRCYAGNETAPGLRSRKFFLTIFIRAEGFNISARRAPACGLALAVGLLFFLAVFLPAQDRSPMSGRVWHDDPSGVDRWGLSPAEWVCENSGYAPIDGNRQLFYLYNTYKHNEGDYEIIKIALFDWAMDMGYAVDFDNTMEIYPNRDIPAHVKKMMVKRNYDVSVALLKPERDTACFYMICWDQEDDIWWTEIYPLETSGP